MARAPGVTTTETDLTGGSPSPQSPDVEPKEVDLTQDSKKPSHSLDEQTAPETESANSTEAATWGEKSD